MANSRKSSPARSPAARMMAKRSCSGIAACRCPTSLSVPPCWRKQRSSASARRWSMLNSLSQGERDAIAQQWQGEGIRSIRMDRTPSSCLHFVQTSFSPWEKERYYAAIEISSPVLINSPAILSISRPNGRSSSMKGEIALMRA